jgi:hypothetical protein
MLDKYREYTVVSVLGQYQPVLGGNPFWWVRIISSSFNYLDPEYNTELQPAPFYFGEISPRGYRLVQKACL